MSSVYGVSFISPTWCYGGLSDTTDFPNEGTDSASGYASGTIRKYSREACEALGEGDNIWSANGECTYVLASDGEGGFGRYNASLICSGLNNSSPTVNVTASLDDLSYDCLEKDNNLSYLLLAVLAGAVLGYTFARNK
jgi:hypothetical protein